MSDLVELLRRARDKIDDLEGTFGIVDDAPITLTDEIGAALTSQPEQGDVVKSKTAQAFHKPDSENSAFQDKVTATDSGADVEALIELRSARDALLAALRTNATAHQGKREAGK